MFKLVYRCGMTCGLLIEYDRFTKTEFRTLLHLRCVGLPLLQRNMYNTKNRRERPRVLWSLVESRLKLVYCPRMTQFAPSLLRQVYSNPKFNQTSSSRGNVFSCLGDYTDRFESLTVQALSRVSLYILQKQNLF